MAALAQADVDAIVAFVGEAAISDGPGPFSSHAMRLLRDLARADDIAFSEKDRIRHRDIGLTTVDGVVPLDAIEEPKDAASYWQIRHEHPVCEYHERSGDYRALRVSDFMSRRQLLRSRVYRDWFKPRGIETEMTVGLDAPRWHTKVFLFERTSGDFSERDRNVVETLRPVLAVLYETNQARKRLAAALELVGDHDTVGGAALVILDGAGRPDFVSDAAQAILTRLGVPPGRLPGVLEERLSARGRVDPGDRIVVPWRRAELVVYQSGDALLFEERQAVPTLTSREREILDLVAEGRTNAEVADVLFIAPGTVRRHLENAYSKLGVHTRTAAVARVRSSPWR